MTAIDSALRPSAFASAVRNGRTPCECVHTVSVSPSNCASAHDGPIAACAIGGLEYRADTRIPSSAGGAGVPDSVWLSIERSLGKSSAQLGPIDQPLSSSIHFAAERIASSALTA